MDLNPETDLEIIRHFTAPPAKVWRCWSDVELMKQWWVPKPVWIRDMVVDLVPGGRFYTLMVIPDHGDNGLEGCILDVVPERRVVFTDALVAGFRPAGAAMFGFTAVITMEPEGTGTLYRALAMHKDKVIRDQHDAMGFHEGWGTCADQLNILSAGL